MSRYKYFFYFKQNNCKVYCGISNMTFTNRLNTISQTIMFTLNISLVNAENNSLKAQHKNELITRNKKASTRGLKDYV